MHPTDLEETIFHEALQLRDADQRSAYLDQACAGHPELRQRMGRLLQAADRARPFFEKTAAGLPPDQPNGQVTAIIPITEKPGDRIGRYKLLQQIGEGGCGVVYMAEQEEPVRRRVALKVIKVGLDTKAVIARFEAERQALALMDHPNIAKVLDAGATETGRPYFVMELVRGIKITDYCDQNSLSTRERLDLFIKVCQAIQHAHQKGVIHRDIKPSNILVTLHDGVPVPKVIDFGIAKATTDQRLTDKTLYTAFEQFIGTPAYMSPEQAELSGLDIDTRSDIYSLGVLLYELLIGKTPFDAKTLVAAGLDEMRRTIREKEPVRPSTKLNQILVAANVSSLKSPPTGKPTTEEEVRADSRRLLRIRETIRLVRGDLDWIVMKCLEKDRTRRYETANGLAMDIQRHLTNEPVVARPPSTAYRVRKFVRRNKMMVIAAGAVALVLVLGVLVSTWLAVRASLARQRAVEAEQKEARQHLQAATARDQAQQAKQDALHNLYIANLNLAQADYDQGNIGRLPELLAGAGRDPGRGFEWYYLQRELHRAQKTFRGHFGALRGVAISPDSKSVVTASMDGNAKLWEVATGREVRTFVFQQARMAAFTRDGGRLAVAGDKKVIVWHLAHDRELLTITNSFDKNVWCVAFSPDGGRIVMGFYQGEASIIVDAATGVPLKELRNSPARPEGIASFSISFSPDGRRVLAGDADGSARIWDAETGALLRRFEGRGGRIWAADFSPDGTRVVTSHDYARVAKVWDVATGDVTHTLKGHLSWVFGAAFSPRGDRIYTTGLDQQVKVWDAATGKELAPLPKCQSPGIARMAVARDGRHILTGSENGEATWWSVENIAGPRILPVILWPEDEMSSPRAFEGLAHGPAAFLGANSENGLVVAAAPDFSVKVMDFSTAAERCVLRGHTDEISKVIASPDLKFIATTSFDSTARVWDARDGRELLVLPGPAGVVPTIAFPPAIRRPRAGRTGADLATVPTVAFSPDSRRLIATSNQIARVWRLSSRQLVQEFDFGPNSGVKAYSPDGKWIAGNVGDRLTLWEAATGQPARPLDDSAGVLSVAWSPDSQRIAAGIWPRKTRIWDVSSRRLLHELTGHRVYGFAMAFSPDGRRLLTGCQDGTAKLWEVATGRELLTFAGHTDGVTSVGFSTNGRQIITGSDDQTIKIWEAASPEDVANWQQEEEEAAKRIEKLRNERNRAQEQDAAKATPENK